MFSKFNQFILVVTFIMINPTSAFGDLRQDLRDYFGSNAINAPQHSQVKTPYDSSTAQSKKQPEQVATKRAPKKWSKAYVENALKKPVASCVWDLYRSKQLSKEAAVRNAQFIYNDTRYKGEEDGNAAEGHAMSIASKFGDDKKAIAKLREKADQRARELEKNKRKQFVHTTHPAEDPKLLCYKQARAIADEILNKNGTYREDNNVAFNQLRRQGAKAHKKWVERNKQLHAQAKKGKIDKKLAKRYGDKNLNKYIKSFKTPKDRQNWRNALEKGKKAKNKRRSSNQKKAS